MDDQSRQGSLRAPEEVRKQKRKELDARRSKCRIRIGSHLDQWCVLKEQLGFSLHSQLAKFLLDSYSSSVSMVCTEQRNEDGLPSSFSVTGETLQQLVILCHDHSQDCGFIPNLKLWTPLERRGRAEALLWECLAGHTISWSLSLSTSQDDIPPTPGRKENVAKSTDVEVAADQLSVRCSQRTLPGQSPRRLRNAGASKRPVAKAVVTHRERREAVAAPQSTFDLEERSSVSMERRREESQETAVEEGTTGQSDFSNGNRHASSEVSADRGRGSRPTDGKHALKRVSARCQWTIFTQNSPGNTQRTEQTEVLAQSLPGAQTAEMADSPNAVEVAITGDSTPCSEASPRDFASFPSLSLEAHEEQAMAGFGLTHEGPQAEIVTGFSGENSAEELEQEEFREYTVSNEEDLSYINDLQGENYILSPVRNAERWGLEIAPKARRKSARLVTRGSNKKAEKPSQQNSERHHRRQSDEDLAQIVKKRIRKTAKREILLCDYEGCGKIFSNRQYLNHHKKYQHVHQNTFTCSDPSCGKSFNFKKHLKEHEKRHSDKRDFICEFCARAFRTNSNLIIHRRIHTGEKPIQCEICGFTCRQKASLNWHMKKHDADSFYPFSCDTCGKRFEKRDNVTAHKNKKHPSASVPAEPHEVPVTEAFVESHGMPLLEAVAEPRGASPPGAVRTEP